MPLFKGDSMSEDLGKKAERKIREWLNRPEDGYCLDRVVDQMSGFYGGRNICDFTLFKSPNFYYIESKATYHDRFDFSMLTEYQHDNMLAKSSIKNVYCWVIVLYTLYQRAFIFDIRDIKKLEDEGIKSLNIKKKDKWKIKYSEIQTISNSRKQLLDYTGEVDLYLESLMDMESDIGE